MEMPTAAGSRARQGLDAAGVIVPRGPKHGKQLHPRRLRVDDAGLRRVQTGPGDTPGVPTVDDHERRGPPRPGVGRRRSHGHALEAAGALRLSAGDRGQIRTCLTFATA